MQNIDSDNPEDRAETWQRINLLGFHFMLLFLLISLLSIINVDIISDSLHLLKVLAVECYSCPKVQI